MFFLEFVPSNLNKLTQSGIHRVPKADIREKISEKLYNGLIKPDEVFVSDGAKCDIGRLQMMFGPGVVSAVQVNGVASYF